MNKKEITTICGKVDHTNLNKTATEADIKSLCADARKFKASSVCVPPCFVKLAHAELLDSNVDVCTVIGFPNGYSTQATKMFECHDAIDNGAKEIDMVINVNMLKDKKINDVKNEILSLADICHSYDCILKVIIETCLLTKNEIAKMCDICIDAGADFIKTSTGFDKAGAKVKDVELMKKTIGDRPLNIKAAGGIHSLVEAKEMIDAGADRIGASAVIKDAKQQEEEYEL